MKGLNYVLGGVIMTAGIVTGTVLSSNTMPGQVAQIAASSRFCEPNGGLREIQWQRFHPFPKYTFVCRNDAHFLNVSIVIDDPPKDGGQNETLTNIPGA